MNEISPISHPPVREFKREELPSDPVLSALQEGEIRANSLRQLIWSSGTSFGDDFYDVIHRTPYWHHNRPHSNHVGKTVRIGVQKLYEHAPEIFDAPSEELRSDLSALALASPFHDVGQLFAQKRYDAGEDSIKVKTAHGLDAAGMILTLAPEYAAANNIPLAEAQVITSKAAVMMMDHEHPDSFDRMFHPNNIHASSLSKEEIINAFRNHELNFWSMGLGDVIDVLGHERKNTGFINGESKMGFTPSFEAEYGKRIRQLRSDYIPFSEKISPESMARMKHLTEVFYFSDMFTMISPVFLTMARTFQAQRSRGRAFSSFHGSTKPSVDQVFHAVVEGSGQTIKADDYRKLWEYVHIDGISQGSVFSGVPWVQETIKDHAGRGVAAFSKVGEGIMRGDYSSISAIFDKYMNEYKDKYMQKVAKDEPPYSNLDSMLVALEVEREDVIYGLLSKHKDYSEGDTKDFLTLCDRVSSHIQTIYGITLEEYQKMQEDVHNGKDAPSQPFDAFSIPSTELKVTQVK